MNNSKYFFNLKSYNEAVSKINSNYFNLISINVRSVSSLGKFNKFKLLLSQFHKLPNVIAMQETWFSANCVNLYSIPGYKAVHCCRSDGYGGTSIFIAENLIYNVVVNRSEEFLDMIMITLPGIVFNHKPLCVMSLYRSQKCTFEQFRNKLENLLQEISTAQCFVVGDFNVDLLSNNSDTRSLTNLFIEFGLESCHKLVTRPLSQTSIDCIFGSLIQNVEVCSIENKLSDHNIISCDLRINRCFNENVTKIWHRFDYIKFGTLLDQNLNQIIRYSNPSDQCKQLVEELSSAGFLCSSSSSTTQNIRAKITPWITKNLSSLLNLKEKLLTARRKDRNNKFISERLKRISKIIKTCNRNLMNDYYAKNLQQIVGDTKKTWRFLNSELGRNRQATQQVFAQDGSLVTTDVDKAMIFNQYFSETIDSLRNNILSNLNDNINSLRTLIPLQTSLNLEKVSKNYVEEILNGISINKSAGFDKITPKMILCRKPKIAEILSNMFGKMIDFGVYPEVLKIHKVVPIPKGIGSNRVDMFRPVSMLSVIDKVLEKIIFNQLSDYLERNNILFERQFGFCKGSGTDEAVVNVIDYICGGFDAGFNGVAGVFFDLSKAFDLVDHDILISKLELLGVSFNSVKLLKSYLENRKHFVQFGDACSSLLAVKCGVPQGSVLGPLLFKIYINDIGNIKFNGKLFMFADDICLLYRYKYPLVLETQVGYDASILAEYIRLNKLVLNADKTKFIRFRPYVLRNDPKMSVYIDGVLIEESDSIKYLGMLFCSNLQWDRHIDLIKAKISSAIGILYKFKHKFDLKTKMLIYESLIHSHLSYLPMIYGWKNTDSIKSLQSAQNKALKIVFNLPIRYHTSDLFQYHAINILPVRGLYKMQLLKYIFKSTRRLGNTSIRFQQNVEISNRFTRQSQNLFVTRCRLELSKQRISFAGPKEFNNLPSTLKNIMPLSQFKRALKSHLLASRETLLN